MTLKKISTLALLSLLLAPRASFAQRGGPQWTTSQMDAQRTAWSRTDANISVANIQKPGFELQWKLKVDNQPRQLESLTQGVTIGGVTLFVPLSIVAGSSNNVYALDNDTGNLFWQRHFDATLPATATAVCPGGIASAATRMASLVPPVDGGRGVGGRGSGGYQSGVGQPGEGVPLQLAVRGGGPGGPGAPPARGAPGAAGAPGGPGAAGAGPPAAGAAGRGAAPGGPGGGFGGGAPNFIYVVSSDGMLHLIGPASGKDLQKPLAFLPSNARVADLIAVNDVVYATTVNNCGGTADGIWAIDLASETKPIVSWKTSGGSPLGVAFSTDGTLYVAVGPGQATTDGFANAILALDPKTLTPKDWFTQSAADFTSGPIVISHKGKELVAAATKDARVYLLDPASLGGTDHATPLYLSRAYSRAENDSGQTALSSWEESIPASGAPAAVAGGAAPAAPVTTPGTRWILMPIGVPPADAGLPTVNGAITNGALLALKIVDVNGKPSLQTGWVSRDLASPSSALVINGVVFGLSRGLYHAPATTVTADRVRRSTPAVLYGFDAMTGKELWSSGKTMTSFVPNRGLWAANSQVYVSTFDGTIHAFGFALERK